MGSSSVVLPPGVRTARPKRVFTARSFWSTVYTPIKRKRRKNHAANPMEAPIRVCISASRVVYAFQMGTSSGGFAEGAQAQPGPGRARQEEAGPNGRVVAYACDTGLQLRI